MQRVVATPGGAPERRNARRGEQSIFSELLEGFMEHASSHNAFGILFVVAFFASFAAVMIQFG
jgi:hypothetical protein